VLAVKMALCEIATAESARPPKECVEWEKKRGKVSFCIEWVRLVCSLHKWLS